MQQTLLHVSPTYYSETSVVGGGEKYIIYMSRAIRAAARLQNTPITDSILAFGEQPGIHPLGDNLACKIITGRPWDPLTIDLSALLDHIRPADVILVHQCLSAFGLFIAAHAKLQNKLVIGIDEGGGEHRLVHHTPEVGHIFDFFHAYSDFCATAFEDIHGRVEVIPGPVDTAYYQPDPYLKRDPKLVLAVGRLLPHKGFDRIIRSLPKDLSLAIVGTNYDSAYYNYLLELAAHSHVSIKQRLTDQDVLILMRTASLFVHASTHIDYRGTYYAKPELLGLAPLEALATGTPTLVSTAGSLPELARLGGCWTFADDEELAGLLNRHSRGLTSYPPPSEIHRDVERTYGLIPFGQRFLAALSGASAAA